MSDDPIPAQILEQLTVIEAGQNTLIEEILDRRQREQDVPLRQRGFGVMEEPPA